MALALLALVGAACTKGAVAPLPPAPSVPQTTSTTVVDLSGIALKPVPGRTTTTIAIQPGTATISGTVVGPNGPVPQATVRAERLVGDGAGSVDIVAAPDGRFSFIGILGGRYRLRAWKQAPDNLALVTPEVFFLDAKESKTMTLTLTLYQGVGITSDIAPKPPVLRESANLVVQVVDRTVDEQGIVRGTPLAGARVELFGAGEWALRSSNPATTGDDGRANFTLECRRAGQQPLSVVVGDAATFPLEIPACAVPVDPNDPGTTTTAPPG
ncbi:MAG TPA: carboxypeptidase-like regulatory domain-containing protein [Acidimicrobiales bacterium]